MRLDFEDKIGRKLTPAELAETVDYQFEGTEHAQIGDRTYTWKGESPNPDWATSVDAGSLIR